MSTTLGFLAVRRVILRSAALVTPQCRGAVFLRCGCRVLYAVGWGPLLECRILHHCPQSREVNLVAQNLGALVLCAEDGDAGLSVCGPTCQRWVIGLLSGGTPALLSS